MTITDAPASTMDIGTTFGRYRLNRAGIRNVWQYDDAVFTFADGRLLLRGKNGAGKSKALEMLLPFLLDGNTRYLDAVGQANRPTFAWLMTDGRQPGNHVGYVWLELRAVDSEGTERFITLGCGIKVPTSTQRTDTWFFITERRVGEDLPLGSGATPWTADKLRQALGEDNVFGVAAYKQRIRTLLFGGVDESRYDNLLHLLHRLRQPNIGDRIERNELPNLLSESLPPVDPEVLDDVAQNLDDLDDIRDQVRRSTMTAEAVDEFIASYTGYARTQVRARAGTVSSHHDTLVERQRAAHAATEARDGTEAERRAAAKEEQRLEERRDAAKADINAITSSDAYKSLAELDDRRALVSETRTTAQALADAADGARARETEAAVDATAVAAAAASAAAGATSARADLGRALVAGAIDSATLGDDPSVTVVGPGAPLEEPTAGLDGDVMTLRHEIPHVAIAGDIHGLERLDSVSQVVTANRHLTERVREIGTRAADALTASDAAAQRAAELDEAVAATVQQLASAEVGAADASSAWYDELVTWAALAAGTTPADAAPWAAVSSIDVGELDSGTARRLLDELRAQVGEAAARAATVTAEAGLVRKAHQERHDAFVAERRAVEEQAVIDPPGPPYREAGGAGAALFSLVDFRENVADADRAGLEAALEASGLLTAWISPTGTVSVDGEDVWATPGAPVDGRSAADVLTAVQIQRSDVDRAVVADVLASIALGDDAAGSSINFDGSWTLGSLRGRWTKPTAEFVGAGARASHRERRLAELTEAIDAAAAEVDLGQKGVDIADAHRRSIEALPAQLPSEAMMVAAEAQVSAARTNHGNARALHAGAASKARELSELAGVADREFRDTAADAHLPADVPQLELRLTELGRIPQLVATARGEHRTLASALEQWAKAASRWERLVEERTETEAKARTAVDKHQAARRAHEALETAVGSTEVETRAALDAAQGRLDDATKRLPKATKRHHTAIGAAAKADGELVHAIDAVADAEAAVAEAVATLRRVLAVDGFARAAFGQESDDVIAELAAIVESDRVASVVSRRAAGPVVTDNTILARYDELLHNLPGGYDVSPSEQLGVKVFVLHDADGAHPIAVAAEQLIADASDAQSRLTAREQEVFQRFLLGNLGSALRHHMQDAGDLIRGMNDVLGNVRTSHGLGVRLEWTLREDASSPTATAKELLLIAGEIRTSTQNDELHRALQDMIDAARLKEPTDGYRKLLEDSLDYRSWHSFTVRVVNDANPNQRQTLGPRAKLSQGEQRVLAYLTLFSAAAAQFSTIGYAAAGSPRLMLLDDAFAKVDEPTHGRLLELLVELDLDFIVTSERLWGMFPGVPSLAIYECLRDPHTPGVATVEFRWDGHQRHLIGL